MSSGLLMRTLDAAGWAEGQREGRGEDASERTVTLCLVGALHVCVAVPRAELLEKAASPPLSLCRGFALSIAVRSLAEFLLRSTRQ